MSILNRLIGDQRKLYQARDNKKYFFKAIESKVSFEDKPTITNEMTYIRNMTGNTDQNAFTGAIKINDKMFTSEYSGEFWGVLALDFDEICEFIIKGNNIKKNMQLDPLSIIVRLDALKKEKVLENIGKTNKAILVLNQHFPEIDYQNNNGKVMPISLYCSSLYLQLERLAERFDVTSAKTKAGGISGVSKRGYWNLFYFGAPVCKKCILYI